jgi:osmoprotectant transport system ATP-binding protein
LPRGTTSSANSSSVSFALSSCRIPIALLTIAIRPKKASANSPSDRIRMKKPAMIALNSVKTLPATMLATDRLVGGSEGPRRSSRFAASRDERPWGGTSRAAASTRPSIAQPDHGYARDLRRSLRLAADDGTPAQNSAEALPVEFRAATKRYGDATRDAVHELTLDVPAGEICVLVGPSGCGKTTAMRMVNRMVEITSGDILVGGGSVRERSPSELRRQVGYVIQQTGLFPHRTVAENLATVPRLLGWDRARIADRIDELLDLIGLDGDLAGRYPTQLSGGQQQRVGVGRALAANPGVMLMDEPFGAVDPINRERLQNEFLRLQAEVRKTILFVTHDIDEALKMGDRIAVMREGGVLAQYATPAELLMSPSESFVEGFVGADRALKRLALLRVSDVDLWEAPLAFPGQATSEVRAKLDGAEVSHALVVDGDRRPLGWLSESDLVAETVPARPGSKPDPIIDSDDVLRDALSDLLQAETLYAPVVDGRGAIAGVLSFEVISDFLTSPAAIEEERPPAERPAP